MSKLQYQIKPLISNHYDWVVSVLKKHWGSPLIISKGKKHFADKLPGFVALQKSEPIGLLIYNVTGNDLEIVALNSHVEGIGVGTNLLEAAKNKAISLAIKRVWCITTNDNLKAQDFYRKRGFSLVAVYKNAIAKTRKLKPQIPLIGQNNIPIKDEVEFELKLN